MRMLEYFSKYFYTIKYLKFSQVFYRLFKTFKFYTFVSVIGYEIRPLLGNYQKPIQPEITMLAKNKFSFLNQVGSINNSSDWNNSEYSKLWLYNLHYFNDLNAKGYLDRQDWHLSIVDQWIEHNDIGLGNGWEPYTLSLRIVNWIKYFISNNYRNKSWEDSLMIQAQYLSKNIEYDILGNHILANSKALIFVGLFFECDKSQAWLKRGESILIKEINEQILDDGGHFELSPMYHSIVLEDFIDLHNIYHAYGVKAPVSFFEVVNKMLKWLAVMIHPDQAISFFNDTTLGVAQTFSDLENYAIESFKEMNGPIGKINQSLITLPYSGYSRIKRNNYHALIDHAKTGPCYLSGHSHADTLSFELSIFEKRIIVNSGISLYQDVNNNSNDSQRHKQRSTCMHSTVELDGKNSSEVWSSFRLARRANVTNLTSYCNDKSISLTAEHDGYLRLPNKSVHKREWLFSGNSLIITDDIIGTQRSEINVYFPFHPDVVVVSCDNNIVLCKIFNNNFKFIISNAENIYIDNSNYFSGFGASQKNKKLVLNSVSNLPYKITTRIEW
jgi:uncharacterized heparinase superfamily protein